MKNEKGEVFKGSNPVGRCKLHLFPLKTLGTKSIDVITFHKLRKQNQRRSPLQMWELVTIISCHGDYLLSRSTGYFLHGDACRRGWLYLEPNEIDYSNYQFRTRIENSDIRKIAASQLILFFHQGCSALFSKYQIFLLIWKRLFYFDCTPSFSPIHGDDEHIANPLLLTFCSKDNLGWKMRKL